MSSFLTSSSRTTMASGLGKRLGSCWHLWCNWFFDYDSGFHRHLRPGDCQCFLRSFDAILGNVDYEEVLTVFDSGCSAGWFAKGSPHSFLKSVSACCGDHLVFSENNVRIHAQLQPISCFSPSVG